MGRITMFANHKGGVGKTFIVDLFAAELSRRGHRVLAVDMDPQGNLSRRFGHTEASLAERYSMAEVVQHSKPQVLKESLLPCQWEPAHGVRPDLITLAPSRIELENRVPEAGVPGAHLRLYDALVGEDDDGPASEYDYVLIDTAPTLGHLLALAAVCADDVIVTVAPDVDSVRGGQRLADFLSNPRNRRGLGMEAELIGFVLNNVRSGVAEHGDLIDTLTAQYGEKVWKPALPMRAPIASTQNMGIAPHATSGEAGPLLRTAAKELVDQYLAAADQEAAA